MSEIRDSQIGKIKYDQEKGRVSYSGAKQSDKILDLNGTNCLVKMIAKRNINTANSKLADLPGYGGYSAWHIAKAWEEICDIFNDIKNNSCKFFVWLGLAWLKLVFKSLDKFKELSQLPSPEEALKDGMSPEEFFAWKNIPNFTDQEIDIVNHDDDKEWKLEFSYDQKNDLTGNIINSSGNKISVKITKISSVDSKDGLLCLHTEDGQNLMVEKTDLLEIGTKNIPEGQIPLKQFLKKNNIHTFRNEKIDVVDRDGNKTDKQLTLSYHCENGFTKSSMQQSINDQNLSSTSVSIKTVSQVGDNNDLLCLYDKSGQEFLVKKSDLLTIDLALEDTTSLKEFFANNNIHSFTDQEIGIVESRGGDKIDKLQLSYDYEKDSTTINAISNDKATATEITAISSIKNSNDLLCLHDKSGQKFLVKKIDMLTMGIALKPGEEVSLKQFFVDNEIPSFQDCAIPASGAWRFGCEMCKMSYDANSRFKGIDPNDGVSIGIYNGKNILNSEYDLVKIKLIETDRVFLIVQNANLGIELYSFRISDLRNFVNSLKENTYDFERNREPINTFFLEKFIPGQECNHTCVKATGSCDNSYLKSVNIKWYGNNCLHCSIYDERTKSWHGTQNVKIKDWSNYNNTVDISGQYLTNENTWEGFNVTVKYDELQNLKCFKELAERHRNMSSYTVPVGIFLKRKNALPPEGQTRSITATQLDWSENNKGVQIEIDDSGGLTISGDTYDKLNLTRDGSCNDGEAIITIYNRYSYDYKYKVKLDDLLGKGDNE